MFNLLKKDVQMSTNTKYFVTTAIAFVALGSVLYQSSAAAQMPLKSDGGQMKHGMEMKHGYMDMKGMMKAMSDKMSAMKTTGKPDIDFAMAMRVHHEGAIQMAEMELKDGKDDTMRKLANEIISAQRKEIAHIDKFLSEHSKMPAMPSK